MLGDPGRLATRAAVSHKGFDTWRHGEPDSGPKPAPKTTRASKKRERQNRKAGRRK